MKEQRRWLVCTPFCSLLKLVILHIFEDTGTFEDLKKPKGSLSRQMLIRDTLCT
jgi:hypothetical protein